MKTHKGNLRYSFRLYIVLGGRRVLGKGGAQILEAVDRLGSISAAASELQMSYRFVWNYIGRMEERLGKQVIVTRRGGALHERRKGGGGTELTRIAKALLESYTMTETQLQKELASRRPRLRDRKRSD
jgi:molybdate transport system regulatory protein